MIRVLIIGRSEAEWRDLINAWAPAKLEADGARLPASGLRQFEATPPDAVIVVEEAKAGRAATLVSAIRERPVGQLIPVVVIAPPAPEDFEVAAEVDDWFGPDISDGALRETLEAVLGEEFAAEQAASKPVEQPGAAQSAPRAASAENYVLEELDEYDDYEDRPRRMTRSSIFSGSQRERTGGPEHLDEEAVRRKLKEVRHEDYFAILEVRRGASNQAIREAFHRLSDAYGDRKLPFEVSHQLSDELAEIRDALEDAWAVLGDPKLREAYIEHTTRK
jgi:hypothetical protein